jgi:hypothetical protein
MDIPRYWRKAEENVEQPDGNKLQLIAWGWSSDSESAALDRAQKRLRNLLTRIKNRDPLPNRYEYGSRPIREEILDEYRDRTGMTTGVITRNSYGSRVLNAARLLFIDVDRQPVGWLKRRFSKRAHQPELEHLRSALASFAPVTFRVYETAAGLRAMSVSHTFEPDGDLAQRILRDTDSDPAFVHLCRLQKSFRARLTPKFWRCRIRHAPPSYPRLDASGEDAFHAWLREYEERSQSFATCRYIETIGSAPVHSDVGDLARLHDAETRSAEPLPLA